LRQNPPPGLPGRIREAGYQHLLPERHFQLRWTYRAAVRARASVQPCQEYARI